MECRYPVYTANEKGLKAISEFIREYEKDGKKLSQVDDAIYYYAEKAENSIGECGTPQFEIRGMNTVSGRPEVCYLDIDEHFDVEWVDEGGQV